MVEEGGGKGFDDMAQRLRFSTHAGRTNAPARHSGVESLANLDEHRASFETPAARAPQDDVLF
jgi:hypothetical protein